MNFAALEKNNDGSYTVVSLHREVVNAEQIARRCNHGEVVKNNSYTRRQIIPAGHVIPSSDAARDL